MSTSLNDSHNVTTLKLIGNPILTNITRRKLLSASLSASAGALLLPNIASAKTKQENLLYNGGLLTGLSKPLPYKSIPGFLSAEQLTPHHDAHYGGALRGYLAAEATLQSSIHDGTSLNADAYGALQRARVNKADSVLLHELYFDGMTTTPHSPTAEITAAIKKRFGSMDKWMADFQACAKSSSGWATLAYHQLNGKLFNIPSDKHATGILWMASPLIIIDVYEHAYYTDYKNNKTQEPLAKPIKPKNILSKMS
jgi:Fe-Mn family superoxide dismutase